VIANGDAERSADGAAFDVVDEAEEDDASDEGPAEAKVNESDEHADGAVAVPVPEGEQGPGSCEDGDYEETQEIVWNCGVGFDIRVDEPAEHAQDGDRAEDLQDPESGEESRGEDHFRGLIQSESSLCSF